VAVPLVAAQPAGASGQLVMDGTVQPLRQATVAAQVGGNVLELAVKAGDRVKAGQLLARVDERDVAAALLRSDAALAQAQAQAANVKTSLERTRSLRDQGFVSQAALDVAQTEWKAAQAGVQQAQAARSQAALARGFAAVTAPFDGIVLATHLEAGDLAVPGRAVATLYAPGALRAVVQVGTSSAEAARSARRIEVELPGGQRVEPIKRTELAVADPVSQTIEWRLDLPAAVASAVLPGQTVRVRFEGGRGADAKAADAAGAAAGTTGTAGALRVPAAAVLHRGELTAVYVAQGERFMLRAVRVGQSRGDGSVDVLAGLQPHERVAADALKAGLAAARPVAGAAPTAAPAAASR
jgi:RND family efflux transporter MFP subunit